MKESTTPNPALQKILEESYTEKETQLQKYRKE
jgi:hypothetical protein